MRFKCYVKVIVNYEIMPEYNTITPVKKIAMNRHEIHLDQVFVLQSTPSIAIILPSFR